MVVGSGSGYRTNITNNTNNNNVLSQSNTNLKQSHSLKIREHPTKGIFVQNLNQYNVTDLKSTMRHLLKGNQNRLIIIIIII